MIKEADINTFAKKTNSAELDIQAFLDSGLTHCEAIYDCKNAQSAYASYRRYVRENNLPVRIIRRKDRVFFVRKDKEEE